MISEPIENIKLFLKIKLVNLIFSREDIVTFTAAIGDTMDAIDQALK